MVNGSSSKVEVSNDEKEKVFCEEERESKKKEVSE